MNTYANTSILISGAVGLTVIDYEDYKFILYSDRHTGYQGICDRECYTAKEVNDFNQVSKDNSICYTVDGAIEKIISQAQQEDKYVDIYLEVPFRNKSLPHSRTFYYAKSNYIRGPLHDTLLQFYSCLYDHINCPY